MVSGKPRTWWEICQYRLNVPKCDELCLDFIAIQKFYDLVCVYTPGRVLICNENNTRAIIDEVNSH